ncbi:UNVERIFIED_CONTAM: hypothetical protein GTU68_056235 [Idotea baltica]|nr:hypothetical protein [Idotea baltica]
MYVLVTYDVSTKNNAGKRRLRRAAKICLDYGQRVQNSVFECQVNPAQFTEMKSKLCRLVDFEVDSLRFYLLGTNWKRRVEHFGAKSGYDIDGALIV